MDPCSVGTPKPHREPHDWASRGKPWSRDFAHRPRSTDIPGIGHFNLVSWSPKLEWMSFFAPNWWVQNHEKLKHPVLVHLWRCCDRKNLNAFSHHLPWSTSKSGFKSEILLVLSQLSSSHLLSGFHLNRQLVPLERCRRFPDFDELVVPTVNIYKP